MAPPRMTAEIARLARQLAESQGLAHVGSWEWDVVSDRLSWTDEHYRIWGVALGTPVDMTTVMEGIHPADRARVQRIIDQSLVDGKPYRMEFRVRRSDGTERIVEARGKIDLDTAGRPIRSHGTAQDVTDGKYIAASLRRLEQRYRDAVENAVEGVFRTTRDGRYVMANQALARMLGYDTPQQLMAERTDVAQQQYVHPEDRALFARLMDAQRAVRGFEYEAVRRDGSRLWLRVHARLVRDGDDVYYEGTVQDISSQRLAKNLLDLRARQQAAVARFGQAAIEQRNLDTLFELASALIVDTLSVEFSQILELRADGDFVFRSGAGWGPETLRSVIPGGPRSQAGLTIASTRPIIMADWGPELREQVGRHFHEHGIASGITVIIGTAEHAFGVLGAHSVTTRNFGIDDVNFLQGVASILAAALVRQQAQEVRDHLLARAISAQEEERTRIARELHDETGQALSAILVGLRSLEHAAHLSEARTLTARLRDLTAQTIRDVGRIARGLRPSTLDDLGLLPALRRYAEELADGLGIRITIDEHGLTRFPAEIETTLYRIIQEALTNVARHARARRATVGIERFDGVVRATIQDDGRGFDVSKALQRESGERALGLVGMEERASLLGGRLHISSRRSGGTRIVVELPLEKPA